MYPNNSVGGWRCRVKVRARQNPAQRDYYMRRGWKVKRIWDLKAARERVLARLDDLEAA